ncbi:glycoside hydrolase superfamily [Fomitopsis betulina]|nr:glycoside hydrolase superfamily [Fomitopsis betulina]
MLASLVFGILYVARVGALDNGVARLPVLGYNTWNAYGCDINENIILETASLMKSLGLQEVGYTHVNLDDCWAEKNRTANGTLAPSAEKFPSGFNNLTSQLNDMGFQAGIYGDSGWLTCAGYPGSYGNELLDATTFQTWGFDYLKFDNCYIPCDDVIREGVYGKYQRMSDAIAQLASSSGKPPLIFSLCEWGQSQVWIWGATVGNSWRVDGDITANWASIAEIINLASFITGYTDYYGRNDVDMLEVGNGNLTYEETKSHFTAWALLKSPLLIGTNLSSASPETIDILRNVEILSINQDPVVGLSISPFRWGINPDWTSNDSYPAQYWSGPTQNGTVFMLLNTKDTADNMTFQLIESPWIRAGRQYSIRDLWTHTDNGTAVRNFTATDVPPHGVVAILVKDVGDEPSGVQPPCAITCSTENGTSVP